MSTKEAIEKAAENIAKEFSIVFEKVCSSTVEDILQTHSNLQPQNFVTNQDLPEDDFTDMNGAIQITNYKRNTIYGYVAKRKIPFKKINRKLIFSKKELVAWIKASRVKTEAELTAQAQKYVANNNLGGHGRK